LAGKEGLRDCRQYHKCPNRKPPDLIYFFFPRELTFYFAVDLRAPVVRFALLFAFPAVAAFFFFFGFGLAAAAGFAPVVPVENFSVKFAGVTSRNISLARLAALPKVEPIALAMSVSEFSANCDFEFFAIQCFPLHSFVVRHCKLQEGRGNRGADQHTNELITKSEPPAVADGFLRRQ